jgi:hypothetical protein
MEMNSANVYGLLSAFLFTLTFAVGVLYFLDLLRFGRVLKARRLPSLEDQVRTNLPLESPIQPAFRVLVRFLLEPETMELDNQLLRQAAQCKRLLILFLVLLAGTVLSLALL